MVLYPLDNQINSRFCLLVLAEAWCLCTKFVYYDSALISTCHLTAPVFIIGTTIAYCVLMTRKFSNYQYDNGDQIQGQINQNMLLIVDPNWWVLCLYHVLLCNTFVQTS